MKITKQQLIRIIKEEVMREKDFSNKLDPFMAIADDFEVLLDKHDVQDPIAVLDELKDRWETMLADQEATDREDGYV